MEAFAWKTKTRFGREPVMLANGLIACVKFVPSIDCCCSQMLRSFLLVQAAILLLREFGSSLRNHITDVLASGIVIFEIESYTVKPWDGKSLPDILAGCGLNLDSISCEVDFRSGIWSKKLSEYRTAGITLRDPSLLDTVDIISWEDTVNLASYLGEQLRNLHLMPFPPVCDSFNSKNKEYKSNGHCIDFLEDEIDEGSIPGRMENFPQNP